MNRIESCNFEAGAAPESMTIPQVAAPLVRPETVGDYSIGSYEQLLAEVEQLKARRDELAAVLKSYRLPLTGDIRKDQAEFGAGAVERELKRRAALSRIEVKNDHDQS